MLKTTTWMTLIVSEEESPMLERLPCAPSMILGRSWMRSTESVIPEFWTAVVAAAATAEICAVVRVILERAADLAGKDRPAACRELELEERLD